MWSRVTNYNSSYASILVSTLDPGSAFLFLGNEIKTCFRPAHTHETEAVQFLKEKHDSEESCFSFTCVLSPGVDPLFLIRYAHKNAGRGSRFSALGRHRKHRSAVRLMATRCAGTLLESTNKNSIHEDARFCNCALARSRTWSSGTANRNFIH